MFISLDVQTQLGDATLAQYTARNEFGWTFAIATDDFMNAIVSDVGRTAANPPSTPHLIIYPDGSTTGLLTGMSSADSKIALIQGT